MQRKRHEERTGLGEAAVKGALASIIGGIAMKLLWSAEQRLLLPKERRLESPTTEVVETTAASRGIMLSDRQARTAAATLYTGSMAFWGTLYGMVQSRLQPPAALHGLLLGGLVYLANFPSFGALPRQGILPPPSEQSAKEAAIPVVPHLAYGLTTAAVFEALN